MTTAGRRVLAAAIVLVGTVVLTGIIAIHVVAGRFTWGSFGNDLPYYLMFAAMIAVGALTIAHDSRHRIGWIFVVSGILMGLSELTSEYAALAGQDSEPHLLGLIAEWVSNWAWAPAFGLFATFLLLWFPTGRPPSPRWHYVEVAAAMIIVPFTLLLAFANDPESTSDIPNPLAIEWVSRIAERVFVVIVPAFPMLVSACAASLVVRFRRSHGDERQQLKWFMLAAAFMAVYMILDTSLVAAGRQWNVLLQKVFELAAFTGLPVAAGIAILKYRLYDIDLVVNRALVYGALTAILAVTYAGLVVAFQAALSPVTRESDLAVAASTLAVAGLFGPVRRRIQASVDRRFYRSRYDAQRALESFSSQLRDEVDLDHLSVELLRVVGTTVRPRHASLWLRGAQ